jgi:uncharacterized phage protein gp47/JayE
LGEFLMPLSLPTLPTLRSTFRANFAARLAGFDAALSTTVAGVISDMLGGGIWAGFRGLGWLSRQMFIDSAEAGYLDRRLSPYGLARLQGTVAAGNVIFSGTNGIVIPQNTPLVPPGALTDSNGNALQFTTQASGTISSGTVTLAVAASGPGTAGNLPAASPLTLVNAIAGVLPQAVLDGSGTNGGTNSESDASFRTRGLARIQSPPQGGAGSDFWAWARASGIPTRAWVFPLNRGTGTCDVAFTIDTRVNPIPLSADLTAVQAAVVAAAPVIGSYQAFAPAADALTITIHGMVPSDATTKAAVTAALVALCASVPPGGATYGDGVTVSLQTGALFPLQVPGTLFLSMIEDAIDNAAIIQSYDLAAPSADVTFATGHLPAVPTVTFT